MMQEALHRMKNEAEGKVKEAYRRIIEDDNLLGRVGRDTYDYCIGAVRDLYLVEKLIRLRGLE